jgi:uncharacterized surface protein with fasciclin (FAS1) repeats
MLSRFAFRALAVCALHLLLLALPLRAQYVGEASSARREKSGFSDKRARSTRTRYSGTISRSNRYRGRDRRLARRLMQAESPAEPPAAWGPVGAPPPDAEAYFEDWETWPWPGDDKEKAGETRCSTLMEIVDTHPSLSRLSNVTKDLPIVREALSARDERDTFFAPTNDAIASFTAWSGFDALERALVELMGDVRWKGYLIAYHAVPDRALTVQDLRLLTGDDRYLEDALEAEMPLFVDAERDPIAIRGLGSSASLVGDEIVACNGVLHMVDHCLLPFDGDGELNDAQRARLRDAKKALDARYPERPTSIDPDAYEDESDEEEDSDDDDDDDSDNDDSDDDSDSDDSDDEDDEKKT